MLDEYSAMNLLAKHFREKNIPQLHKLNNEITRGVVNSENKNMLKIGILAYVFSQILERPRFFENVNWNKFNERIYTYIDASLDALKKKNYQLFNKILEDVKYEVLAMDKTTRRFVLNLFETASIKTAGNLYFSGYSVSKAAEMADVDKLELVRYLGSTVAHDTEEFKTLSIMERIKNAKELFK